MPFSGGYLPPCWIAFRKDVGGRTNEPSSSVSFALVISVRWETSRDMGSRWMEGRKRGLYREPDKAGLCRPRPLNHQWESMTKKSLLFVLGWSVSPN